MNAGAKDSWCNPRVMAVAIARWCLGILFLFLAVGKFRMGIQTFVNGMTRPFEKTWLPSVLLNIFGHVLPFWEITVGVFLVLGLFRNATLFATGVLLLCLTFGQVVLGQNVQIIFFNTAYTFMAAALLFLGDYDRWVLFPRPAQKATDKTQP